MILGVRPDIIVEICGTVYLCMVDLENLYCTNGLDQRPDAIDFSIVIKHGIGLLLILNFLELKK